MWAAANTNAKLNAAGGHAAVMALPAYKVASEKTDRSDAATLVANTTGNVSESREAFAMSARRYGAKHQPGYLERSFTSDSVHSTEAYDVEMQQPVRERMST